MKQTMGVWALGVMVAAVLTLRPAMGGEEKKDLPGSRLTVAQAKEGRFGMIAVCKAANAAVVEPGEPPNTVTQSFRLIEVLAGEAPEGAVGKEHVLNYRLAATERAIRKGETVLWVTQAPNEDEWEATKALEDTPENRKAVAGKG